jgi:hypothetical protein
VDLFEQLREFQAAMAFFDAGVDLPGQQVQACQEAQGAMPLVFVVPTVGCPSVLDFAMTSSLDLASASRTSLALIGVRPKKPPMTYIKA